MRPFDLVAFDGDDTLWHNERHYRDGRERFHTILREAGFDVDAQLLDEVVDRTEVHNIEYFGYGVSGFTLSLIEAAVVLTGGEIGGRAVDQIVSLAKGMLTTEIELFPMVKTTVAALSRRYPLMLITKGDLLHQRSKLARSGLERYFRYVEVVSHKTPDVYDVILERHRVKPGRFLMVGNSLRSDILPVVALGARAVYIPASLSWSHEHAEPTAAARRRYFERKSMRQLVQFIESLGRTRGVSGKTDAPRKKPATDKARKTVGTGRVAVSGKADTRRPARKTVKPGQPRRATRR